MGPRAIIFFIGRSLTVGFEGLLIIFIVGVHYGLGSIQSTNGDDKIAVSLYTTDPPNSIYKWTLSEFYFPIFVTFNGSGITIQSPR
jgi:hypothetical protein